MTALTGNVSDRIKSNFHVFVQLLGTVWGFFFVVVVVNVGYLYCLMLKALRFVLP